MTTPQDTAASSTWVRRSPVYYGWVVLGISTLGMAATFPGQTAGMSLFIDAFIEDLDLSRSLVSGLYAVATVLGSLFLPLVGRLLDRFGPRRVAVVVITLLAASCAGMSQIGGWFGVLVGFTFLRGSGQSALGLVNNHAVNLWFQRRRGLAIGVLGLGMAGATALFPPWIEQGLQTYGWKTTYLMMGGLLAVVMLPLGALLYRDAPERYGLSPSPSAEQASSSERPAEDTNSPPIHGVRPETARWTWTFWLLTMGGLCTAGLGTGLLFHHVSILEEVGVTRAVAAQFFIPLGIVTAVSNLGMGWLVDRVSPRLLLGVLLAVFGGMLGGLPAVNSTIDVWVYGSIFGVAQGMQGAILGTGYAHYFGRAHHGTIRGLATTVFIGGTALGPFVLALGPRLLGGFAPILWLTVPLPLLLAGLSVAGWYGNWDADVLRPDYSE